MFFWSIYFWQALLKKENWIPYVYSSNFSNMVFCCDCSSLDGICYSPSLHHPPPPLTLGQLSYDFKERYRRLRALLDLYQYYVIHRREGGWALGGELNYAVPSNGFITKLWHLIGDIGTCMLFLVLIDWNRQKTLISTANWQVPNLEGCVRNFSWQIFIIDV